MKNEACFGLSGYKTRRTRTSGILEVYMLSATAHYMARNLVYGVLKTQEEE